MIRQLESGVPREERTEQVSKGKAGINNAKKEQGRKQSTPESANSMCWLILGKSFALRRNRNKTKGVSVQKVTRKRMKMRLNCLQGSETTI